MTFLLMKFFLESRLESIVPDIIIVSGNKSLAVVEIKVTHAVDEIKAFKQKG